MRDRNARKDTMRCAILEVCDDARGCWLFGSANFDSEEGVKTGGLCRIPMGRFLMYRLKMKAVKFRQSAEATTPRGVLQNRYSLGSQIRDSTSLW